MEKKIIVMIATHKKYEMPKDKIYLPIQVGAEQNTDLGYQKDNSGENISIKNPFYCELTALYWGWKNLNSDYIGLVHYRRHFKGKKREKMSKMDLAISGDEIDKILDETDVILPKMRNYYIENLYSHYDHTTYIETLNETRNIIQEMYPQYIKEFDRLHKRTSAHMFNMFIMKKELLDKYCTWLFDILYELEKRVDPRQYEAFHARYPGRISELLMDVWINTNQIKYKEVSVLNIEGENLINKGISFLKAKLIGKKYEKSF